VVPAAAAAAAAAPVEGEIVLSPCGSAIVVLPLDVQSLQ